MTISLRNARPVEAVIFNMDGLLVDTEKLAVRAVCSGVQHGRRCAGSIPPFADRRAGRPVGWKDKAMTTAKKADKRAAKQGSGQGSVSNAA